MTQTAPLLTPGEVALMFGVDPKTVTRWAVAGRLGSIRTPGGHRRYRASEVTALLADEAVSGATPGRSELHRHNDSLPAAEPVIRSGGTAAGRRPRINGRPTAPGLTCGEPQRVVLT
jgi:excisionase family DNA binding protein